MSGDPVTPPAPPPIDDFHPPYHLGAFGCALIGVWNDGADPPPPPDDLGGFEAVRWLGGGHLGAALVLRYDRPSPDYPVVYSEIILSYVVRRGLTWAAMPFDLVLDNPFYVQAGLRHYHLPKRLDAGLRIELEGDEHITASGDAVSFEATLGPLGVPGLPTIASTLLHAFTGFVPILGTSSKPFLTTTIEVRPDATTTRRADDARIVVSGRTMTPIASLFWRSLDITVGVPAAISD